MQRLLRISFPLLILGLGYGGYRLTSETEPKPPPPMPERRVLETEAETLARKDYTVQILTQGIMRPHNETSLTPRVSGRVTHLSPKFESGSFFQKGDVLIELDPSDFESSLSSAEARLARAEASLAQEKARAEQALLDWKELGYSEEPTDLVLRKPQLKQAVADVKAAQADLTSAERNLERSKVRAPYAGRVKERLVGLGQSVSPGTKIGDIFSTDFAEVRLPLSTRELGHVTLPNNPGDPAVPVTLIDALTQENPSQWEAQIVRTEGTLDEKSRKLFVIARVDDPFSLKNRKKPSLRIGQPIRAVLDGEVIPQVFIIPRIALRRPNEVIVIEPERKTLKVAQITPIWSDLNHLIVRDGLTEGWLLSTSRMPNAPKGSPVIILEKEEDTSAIEAASTEEKSSSPGA